MWPPEAAFDRVNVCEFTPVSQSKTLNFPPMSELQSTAMASAFAPSSPGRGAMPSSASAAPVSDAQAQRLVEQGAKLYEKHCAECHRADGSGKPPAYPRLAGNHSIVASSVNPIRMVLNGGYPPSTTGNPQPYGMPPYGPWMNDEEVAAVVSYVRSAWGNQGAPVGPGEVSRYRTVPLE